MPVREIVIDEAAWSSASRVRRDEWRALISDLLRDDPPWPALPPCCVTMTFDEALVIVSFDVGGISPARLPRDTIADLVNEYLAVIKRLEEDGSSVMRMEALDMAKKVVHDEGARRIGSVLPEIGANHETRRRFFSLVVSLLVDTTGRRAAHRHL